MAGLHPQVGAEPEAAAAVAGADIAAAAGEAAAAPHRQQAAGAVLPQQPCAHWEGLCLLVGYDL